MCWNIFAVSNRVESPYFFQCVFSLVCYITIALRIFRPFHRIGEHMLFLLVFVWAKHNSFCVMCQAIKQIKRDRNQATNASERVDRFCWFCLGNALWLSPSHEHTTVSANTPNTYTKRSRERERAFVSVHSHSHATRAQYKRTNTHTNAA